MQLEPGFVTEAEKPSGDGEVTVEALDRGGRALATTGAAGRPVRYAAAGAEAGGRGRAGRLPGEGERSARDLRRPDRARARAAPGGEPKGRVAGGDRGRDVRALESAGDGTRASLAYSDDGGETWTPLSLPGTDDGSSSTRRGSRAGSAACSSSSPATASTPRAPDRPSTRSSRRAGSVDPLAGGGRDASAGEPGAAGGAGVPPRGAPAGRRPDRLDVVAGRRAGRGRAGPGDAEPGERTITAADGRRVRGGRRLDALAGAAASLGEERVRRIG